MNKESISILESIGAVSYQDLLREYNERVTIKETDGAANRKNNDKDSRFVPIKLKPEEAKRALECQKVMLEFAHRQYRKSIGTSKEENMKKMYNDALIDYETFMLEHKAELQ